VLTIGSAEATPALTPWRNIRAGDLPKEGTAHDLAIGVGRSRELFRAAGLPTPRFANHAADVNLARVSSERHQAKLTTNMAPANG
jgi:hypothetical protein